MLGPQVYIVRTQLLDTKNGLFAILKTTNYLFSAFQGHARNKETVDNKSY